MAVLNQLALLHPTTLSHWSWVWSLPLFLATLTIAYGLYNVFLHPLREVPGPLLASVSPFWQVYTFWRGSAHLTHIELHDRYGPVVRVGPNDIIINDSTYFPPLFNWNKADWWIPFRAHPVYLSHVSVRNVKEHIQRKKLVQGAYRISVALKKEPAMDQHISTLTSQISMYTGRTFDLAPWIQFLTLDIAMDVVYSNPIHFLVSGSDIHSIVTSLKPIVTLVNIMGLLPILSKILLNPVFFATLSPKSTDKSGSGVLHRYAYNQIERRYQDPEASSKKYDDILQWIIDKHQPSSNPRDGPLSWPLLVQELVAPIMASFDTPAAVIRAAILYIATNPMVLSRLRAEIDTADSTCALSDPVPSYREITEHVPYLELIFKETVRIYPPTGIPLPRAVPNGGTEINGYHLPAGTSVGVSQWAVGRSAKIFGDDVEVFRPERWSNPGVTAVTKVNEDYNPSGLGHNSGAGGPQSKNSNTDCTDVSGEAVEEAKRKRKLRDSGYMPFSLGPMQCTGRSIAMMITLKTLAHLFRRFDVQIVNPARPWKDANRMSMVQWDFFVRVTERQDLPTKVNPST